MLLDDAKRRSEVGNAMMDHTREALTISGILARDHVFALFTLMPFCPRHEYRRALSHMHRITPISTSTRLLLLSF